MSEESERRLITGIPLWLLEEYLQKVGAQRHGDEWRHPQGWRAQLNQAEDYQIGSLRVGQVWLRLSGEPEALQQARRILEPYLLRAGG